MSNKNISIGGIEMKKYTKPVIVSNNEIDEETHENTVGVLPFAVAAITAAASLKQLLGDDKALTESVKYLRKVG